MSALVLRGIFLERERENVLQIQALILIGEPKTHALVIL